MKHTPSAIVMITMMGSAGNVAADDSEVLRDLVSRFNSLQSKVTVLEAALETKQAAMDCLYQVGTDLYVDGCNLHVQDGTGFTFAGPNGLGNLIVGYNEDDPFADSEKTGSHNVIVGAYHTYTNTNGLVAGINNTIAGHGAAVTGGKLNVASGWGSSVNGGYAKEASGYLSSVRGGIQNVGDTSYQTLP